MISNNVRILDANNHPSSYGRVEIRVVDTWNAICGQSVNNNDNANILCQQAGYMSGEV